MTMYGLPEVVEFCSKCVISNQRMGSVVESGAKVGDKKPAIQFIGGICSACRYGDIKEKINWKDRERQLKDLCNRYRRKDGGHSVIVCGSGGKDSFFVSLKMKEYGMNPLTVTWAPQLRTDAGQRNFDMWNRHHDNIQITPGGNVHRTLTRLSFVRLLHAFAPFVMGQRNVAPRLSTMTGIPLIMYGESPGE